MGELIFLTVAAGIYVLLAPLLGIIGFFKVSRLETEISKLRQQIQGGAKPAQKPAQEQTPPPKPKTATQPAKTTAPPEKSVPIPPTPRPKSGPGFTERLERSLRGNWLIWVAGIALAFGGVFIVQFAAEAGWLGPHMRVALAILAGTAMLVSAHILRGRPPKSAALSHSLAPAILAGAGLITLYGAVYASFSYYHLIGAGAAFAVLAIIAIFALYQALLFGPVIAAFGLVGAFLVPLLIGAEQPSALKLFGYVFVVSVGGLVLARMRPWRWNAILALAGGLGWPLLWLMFENEPAQTWVLQLYLPAMLAVTLSLAWAQAKEPFFLRGKHRAGLGIFTAMAAFLGGGALLLWVVQVLEHSPSAMLAMGALGLLAILAAWRREGFAPIVMIMAAFSALALALWPNGQAALVDAPEQLNRFVTQVNALVHGPSFLRTCFGFAALFGFGGYLAALHHQRRAVLVTVSAAFPSIILFIAYWRITGMQGAWPFALAALVLAGAILVLLEGEARIDPKFSKHPGAVAALALGVSGALLLVFLTLFSQMWLSLALAGQALMTAILWRRFGLLALQRAAMVLALIASFRLLVLHEAFDMALGNWPIFNHLLTGLGGSAALLTAAVFVFRSGGVPKSAKVIQSLSAAALAIFVAMCSLQIHHFLGKGDLFADIGFAETGLQISMYGIIAVLIRWRLGADLAFTPKWSERIGIFLSGSGFLVLACWLQNPWWGLDPQSISGNFVLNTLGLAFALPAITYAAYGHICRKQGQEKRGRAFLLLAGLAGFLWATLQVRFGFHGADLSSVGMSDGERYAYSASWLVYGLCMLGIGFVKQRAGFRLVGLVLLALVSVKVFVLDMADLGGLLRGVSFLGLGASLMGIGLLYQRFGASASIAAPKQKTGKQNTGKEDTGKDG